MVGWLDEQQRRRRQQQTANHTASQPTAQSRVQSPESRPIPCHFLFHCNPPLHCPPHSPARVVSVCVLAPFVTILIPLQPSRHHPAPGTPAPHTSRPPASLTPPTHKRFLCINHLEAIFDVSTTKTTLEANCHFPKETQIKTQPAADSDSLYETCLLLSPLPSLPPSLTLRPPP